MSRLPLALAAVGLATALGLAADARATYRRLHP